MDQYQRVESNDWRANTTNGGYRNGSASGGSRGGKRFVHDYNIKSLDSDWFQITKDFLKSVDEVEAAPGRRISAGQGIDVLDARGTFDKNEFRRELKRLSSDELENRLGITFNKIDTIFRRLRPEKDGRISYKKFLEEVRLYRVSSEQESRTRQIVRIFAFTEEFSCVPPTLFMIIITCLEAAFFTYTSLNIERDYNGASIGWFGPVPYCSIFIYNPNRRFEAWRYFSYMFVHIGIQHFVFNMIMQIFVGIPLEMSQSGWTGSIRVMLVYLAGVVAASLGTSITDPKNYIAGASGGVYSLIAAHLATVMINWQEDSSIKIQKVIHKPVTRIIRLTFITILTLHDIGFAIYVRMYDPENRTGFTGHLCGAIAGVLVGLVVLENRRAREWEWYLQAVSVVFFIGLLAFACVWNAFADDWYPETGYFPKPDYDLYESFGACKGYRIF